MPHSGTQQQRSACSFVIPSPEPLDYLLSIDPEEAPRGPGLNTLISTPHLPAVRRLGRHRGVGRPGRRGNENTPPPSRCGCARQRGVWYKHTICLGCNAHQNDNIFILKWLKCVMLSSVVQVPFCYCGTRLLNAHKSIVFFRRLASASGVSVSDPLTFSDRGLVLWPSVDSWRSWWLALSSEACCKRV